jgi:hypothetical protein
MHIQLLAFEGGENEHTSTPLDAHASEKPRRTELLPSKRMGFTPAPLIRSGSPDLHDVG